MQSIHHRISKRIPAAQRGRCGAIGTAAALTIAGLIFSGLYTTKDAYDQGKSMLMIEEIKAQAPELIRESQRLMEMRCEQLHRRGELTDAELQLAIIKIRSPQNAQVLNGVVDELYRQQRQLSLDGARRFHINGLFTLATLYMGQLAEQIREGHLLFGSVEANRLIQESRRLGIGTDLLGVLVTAAGPLKGDRFLTPEQFVQILEDAERRMQEENPDSKMQFGVRARVHAFFDKWHLSNLQRTAVQAFYDQFKSYKDQFAADFNQYIQGELTQEGWVIEPQGLQSFAWDCMEEYAFYKETFELDVTGNFVLYLKDPASGQLMPAQLPSAERRSQPALLRCQRTQPGGAPVCTVEFSIPNEAAAAFKKMGVAFPQGLAMPLERVESDAVPFYRSDAPDVQKLVGSVSALVGALMHASESVFSNVPVMIRVEPRKGIITLVRPPDSAHIVIKLEYDCVVNVSGEDPKTHRMQGTMNLLGKRMASLRAN